MSEITEGRMQSDCYLWFHNEYPELRGLLCYNLNNSRNKIQAMMDKAMGLQAGRSDMVFYYNGKSWMLEAKLPNGTQQPNQIEWEKKITKAGFSYQIFRSLEEFQKIIRNILH